MHASPGTSQRRAGRRQAWGKPAPSWASVRGVNGSVPESVYNDQANTLDALHSHAGALLSAAAVAGIAADGDASSSARDRWLPVCTLRGAWSFQPVTPSSGEPL